MLVRITNSPKRKAIDWLVKEEDNLPDFSVTYMDSKGITVSLDRSDAEDFMELSGNSGFECDGDDEDEEENGTPRITSAGKKKGDSAFKMPKYRP